MSGPFRFHQEEARSPLDRSASPFSAGQPVSFKTNVNRAKTKKWVQAKKNAYDGDDWGDYDEYDEYGANQEPQQAQPRYYAQHLDQPSRSFTDPSHQALLPRARRNSFEQGEEQRAFSSTIPHSQHGHIQPHEDPQGPAGGAAFAQDYDMGGRGDFSPTAVPPPLQTRISQVPADFNPPSNTQFPPRKSSIGQGDLPIGTSPRPRNGSGSDKPLPFIRPADVYKRHHDERTSLDSSRPSLDSPSSPSRDDAAPGQEGGKSLHPMETVAERKSEYLADYDATATQNNTQPHRQERPVVSPPDDQGLRSVVDQAFTRTDDSRSVPPTPVSQDSSSDLLRSNTGSTSGISPIMSRVPSSAASALKSRNHIEGSTPVIAEEPSETTTPVTRPTSAHNIEAIHHVPRKPSPGHTRNFSGSSAPHSGLATPTRGDSPARSPVLAPSRDVPEPKSALFSTEDNDSSGDMEGGLQGPSSAYAAREADLAIQSKSRPNSGAVDLGVTERQSQVMFLDSHNAQSPIEDVLPRDRSESPSKGRVQALAGKFGEVASSRRGSTQSNRSRNSMQSWERSHENSRAASPTKGSPSKPSSPVKEFRPHLPGQWESYTTTAMTPSEQGEQDRGLGTASNNQASLEKSGLTPTTAKQSVAEGTPSDANDSDPMAALRNAGAAMVDSIRTTLGADEQAPEGQREQKEHGEHGNVYLPRPLQLDRTMTSNSSAPPTPPANDMSEPELAPPAPLKERSSQLSQSQPDRPSLDPQLSTDPSAEDQESDRLRKEIVASLSPFKAPESPAGEPNDTTLVPASPGTNRASSILPSEYKSYWAEEDRASRRSSRGSEPNAQEQPSATVTFLPQSEEPTQPIMKRFSWEASNSQSQTPDDQAEKAPTTGTTMAEPETKVSPPVVESAAEHDRQQPPEGQPDSYFGTDHTFTVTKPDPSGDPEKPVQLSPPLDPTRPMVSPTREGAHSPGLHVVNTEFNPEAVDLPPRFSADNESPREPSGEPKLSEKKLPEPAEHHPAVESPGNQAKVSTAVQGPSDTKSPTTDKPWGAREIATLNSAAERIDTYNKTREHWATVDHGLSDWLTATLEAKPELATQTFPAQRVPTASARHRHTGSLALFGKFAGSSSVDLSSDQQNTASAPPPASTSSPTTVAPSGSGFGGRIANQQMQLKGKDLLHTANVLGGKGMTSAKGLFAKGKSRFGREKASSHTRTDSAPSSREVSEEPELVTRRPRAQTGLSAVLMRSVTEKDKEGGIPNEEKKKRRFSFSSQFRRASRSRSRPNSVALPDPSSVVGTTPKTSPPRELHHFLMDDHRPNSFHTQDSWASYPGVPPTALNEYFNTTPPRRSSSQPRLGILPSPAKSAFSGQDGDTEHHVPPVPPIPDEVATKHYRRRSSQDSASHRMLQSVIRHSTPPIVPSRQSTPSVVTKDKRSLTHAPVFTDDMQSGAEETAEDYKSLLRTPEGSFQPDHPASESELSRNEGFQFGFTEKAPIGATEIDDDDDDQPPRLNHDPLPAPTSSEQDPFFVDRHMDVSDEDSDDKPSRGRDSSTLPAPNVEPEVDSVNPVLPTFVILPGKQTINEKSIEAKPDDKSANSIHEHLANVDKTGPLLVDLGKGTSNLAKSSPSQAGYPESMLPIAVHCRLDELAVVEGQVGSKDRTSIVESPTLGYYGENVRTGETREGLRFDPEGSGLRDSSDAFDASPDSKDNDAAANPEEPDAERAFSPVWFTKKDLELPTARNALSQKETFSPDGIEQTTISQDPESKAVGQITAPDQQPGATRTDGEASLSPDPVGANADTSQTRRVATSPSHAVQENAILSAASWEYRDTPHIPLSDAHTFGEMNDESSFVTPVAPVPRIVESGPESPKAGTSHDDDSRSAIPNGHARTQNAFPDFKHQAQQLQASSHAMTAPERSRSLLSQISAMVSEEGSTPYSQASTGRSTPSTIRRMQPESSTKPSTTPAQIPEEATAAHGDRTISGEDDDFDLYADHNGIVKDMQDERGQPLRLAEPQTTGLAPQPQLMKSPTPSIGTAPGSRDGNRPRYSTERPMSFISGPADQDGKPQDQINQVVTPEDMEVSPVPRQYCNQTEEHYTPPTGTVYSVNPPNDSDPLRNQDQSPHHPPPAHGSHPTKNIFRAVKSIDPVVQTTQVPVEHSSPFHANSQQVRPEMANAHGRPLHDNQIANRALHESQAQRDQSVPRGVSDLPSGQSSYSDSRYPAPNQGPRNQYELHQQTQLQASHPHLQTIKNKQLAGPAQPLFHEVPRPHEKPSSKPRLSSMFKNLGGKAPGDLQQQSSAGNVMTDPSLKPLPADPNPHNPSHSSASWAVSPREASMETREQLRYFAPPTHPDMGQQSHFTQGPQFGPWNHRDSMPSNGIPSQRPFSTSSVQSPAQPTRRVDAPEGGKKKRFSALGAFFGRGGAGGDSRAPKLKLSKEDKKAKKAQQDYVAASAQPLPSQWAPEQQSHRAQQSGLAYYSPGQLPPHTVQGMPPAGPKYEPPRFTPETYSQSPSQQMQPPRQSISSTRPDEGSAFLRTKQLAEEHYARQKSRQSLQATPPPAGSSTQNVGTSFDRASQHLRQGDQRSTPGDYYKPDFEHASGERGAYAATSAARQEYELYKQRGPSRERDIFAVAQAEQMQTPRERQPSPYEQSGYRDARFEQQQAQEQAPHHPSEQWTHEAWLARRQQMQQQQEQSAFQRAFGEDHQSPQPDQHQYPPQSMHHQPNGPHPPFTPRSVSGPDYNGTSQDVVPVSPPAESTLSEPRYEAPPIPAAYSQVSGAFISPLDRQQQPDFLFHQDQPIYASRNDVGRQYSDPKMQAISPQVSAQSQVRPNNRSHSEASTTSIVSPISNSPAMPSSSPPPGVQQTHKPRMSSISEVQQPDRPWHLNFPAGATEQEIVRARQGQYMQDLFNAQQQQQAERAAGSPSPRASPENVTPTLASSPHYSQGGGYREILPRNSPHPYVPQQSASPHHDRSFTPHRDPTPDQSASVRSEQSPQSTAYPLPMSRGSTGMASPFNPIAGGLSPAPLPPPKIPYTPMGPAFPDAQLNSISGNHSQRSSSPDHDYLAPQYDEQVPDDAPPSYDSPGLPNDGMGKSRPDALRPPNIITDMGDDRRRQIDSRPRQASIGMLVHPQPASMAASPQRTLSDMGAESLRRQLLQQENLVHMERVQREQEQREARERERQEREAARARARELERSASGGGQVGSLRSVHGSPNGSGPGWERRGSSHSRPVFELPAVEDDEPTMKATSYPGQEWVPPMWDGD
ncbi:SWI-SNF chromatin-remodeling complex protein [Stemphylium lycopersici]|uniref:SWI-SNF chromatin-remodeling complex protein n=1 Tax=Stemphylium lycopersici TaxID=183478 RepID=A0A364NDN7_STELY|nr:SWI-SNF chromatin-remodeling complex protein [Stemphylium lycopersici]